MTISGAAEAKATSNAAINVVARMVLEDRENESEVGCLKKVDIAKLG